MNQGFLLWTAVTTGFAIAFLHAAMPTHWLPFVLVGRAQRWNRAKTLTVTAAAGAGHVLFTTALGILLVWIGIKVDKKARVAFPLIAGGALFAFGLYYVVQQFRGKGHGHSHLFGSDSHDHGEILQGPRGGCLVNLGHGFVEITVFETGVPPEFRLFFYDQNRQPRAMPRPEIVSIETVRPDGVRQRFSFRAAEGYLASTAAIPEPHEFKAVLDISHGNHTHRHEVQFEDHDHHHQKHGGCDAVERMQPLRRSDWAAIGSLLALLTFSPCEGFLPIYVSGVRFGWLGFGLLSAILALGTLAGMVIFTWLSLMGFQRMRFAAFEKYEAGLLGAVLCILGVVVILFEH